MARKPLHLVAALLCAGVSFAQRWEDSLSLERAGLAAAAVGRQVLFAGGWGWNTNIMSDVVDVYSRPTTPGPSPTWRSPAAGWPRP